MNKQIEPNHNKNNFLFDEVGISVDEITKQIGQVITIDVSSKTNLLLKRLNKRRNGTAIFSVNVVVKKLVKQTTNQF